MDQCHDPTLSDATVVEQAIRYPTDLGLLNEAREISEQIIDLLYPLTNWNQKPRTYRQTARKAYLAIVKQRRPGARKLRKGIRQQLQYVRRDLKHINALLDALRDNRYLCRHGCCASSGLSSNCMNSRRRCTKRKPNVAMIVSSASINRRCARWYAARPTKRWSLVPN